MNLYINRQTSGVFYSLYGSITSVENTLGKTSDTIVSNLAGVKTALASFASKMNEGTSKLVRIVHTDNSDTSIMNPHVRYMGYLTKNTNVDFSWIASAYLANEPAICLSYYSGNNFWREGKIALIKTKQYTNLEPEGLRGSTTNYCLATDIPYSSTIIIGIKITSSRHGWSFVPYQDGVHSSNWLLVAPNNPTMEGTFDVKIIYMTE